MSLFVGRGKNKTITSEYLNQAIEFLSSEQELLKLKFQHQYLSSTALLANPSSHSCSNPTSQFSAEQCTPAKQAIFPTSSALHLPSSPLFINPDKAKRADIAELVVALYEADICIASDGSPIGITPIAEGFKWLFNLTNFPKYPHQLRQEILGRKRTPVRFIQLLSDCLKNSNLNRKSLSDKWQ